MTDNTQPDALRLADELEREKWHVPAVVMQAAAEELRRQHARIAELEAQLESIGAVGVQALSAAPVKACVCGEPQAPGTVHRVDGPCYEAAPQQEAQQTDQSTAEISEIMRRIGELQAFEAWFKVDCPVEGVNARIAAKSAWQARAALDAASRPSPTPQADSQPAPDERDDFEKVFPLPSGCIRVGTGYASTGYSNWAAHTHCERWQGWQARAARAPADPQLLKFYGVTTDAELIAAQARHIERLQAKLPQTQSFAPQLVREG